MITKNEILSITKYTLGLWVQYVGHQMATCSGRLSKLYASISTVLELT